MGASCSCGQALEEGVFMKQETSIIDMVKVHVNQRSNKRARYA